MEPFRFRVTFDENVIRGMRNFFIPAGFRYTFYIAGGIFLISLAINLIDKHLEGVTNALFCLFICIMGLFVYPRLAMRTQKRRLFENHSNGCMIYECVFEEDGVHIFNVSDGGKGITEYRHYTRCVETKDLFVLSTKGRQYIVIPKEDMDLERRAQFIRFLCTHCPNLKKIKK